MDKSRDYVLQKDLQFEKEELAREERELSSWGEYFNYSANKGKPLTIAAANRIVLSLERNR